MKKNKVKRSLYHISNKLRECAKFLEAIRVLSSNYTDMLSVMKPEYFDDAIEAVKKMARYEPEKRAFGVPSLALHFGTSLIHLAELAIKLVLRKNFSNITNTEKKLTEIERFKTLIKSQWTTELGSLAIKDLSEKASIKPQLLPLTEDIMKLAKLLDSIAKDKYELLRKKEDIKNYKILLEVVLVLTIIHNRKRVGDIQYLDLESYNQQVSNKTATEEFETSLTENERLISKLYIKITAIGKGSRPVSILLPKALSKFYLV